MVRKRIDFVYMHKTHLQMLSFSFFFSFLFFIFFRPLLSLSSPLSPPSSSNVFQTDKHIFQYLFIRNASSSSPSSSSFLLPSSFFVFSSFPFVFFQCLSNQQTHLPVPLRPRRFFFSFLFFVFFAVLFLRLLLFPLHLLPMSFNSANTSFSTSSSMTAASASTSQPPFCFWNILTCSFQPLPRPHEDHRIQAHDATVAGSQGILSDLN